MDRVEILSSLQDCLIQDIQLKEVIHHGTYNNIVQAKWEGLVVAVKQFHNICKDECKIAEYERIHHLSHANIVRVFGIYFPTEAKLPSLVMERLECSLYDLLEQNLSTPIETKISYLHQIGLGLRYLHSRVPPIIHGRLSSKKVLISKGMEAKIIYVGAIVKAVAHKSIMQSFETNFMAPETLEMAATIDRKCGKSTDIFSFGCITLHTFSSSKPSYCVVNKFITRVLPTSELLKRNIQHLDKAVEDIILPQIVSCLKHNPSERPSINKVCDHLEILLNDKKHLSNDSLQAQSLIKEAKQLHHGHMGASKQIIKEPLRNLKLTWQQCASLPVKCWATSVAVCDGIIYVSTIHGIGLYMYDPNKNSWSQPSWLPYVCDFTLVAVPNKNQLLIVGGLLDNRRTSNKVFQLDEISKKWIITYPNMPTPRCRCSSISHGSKVIVAGGIKWSNPLALTAAVEVLHINDNPCDSYWSVLQYLPIEIFGSVPMIINRRLYLAAGYNENFVTMQVVLTAFLPDLLEAKNDESHLDQVWNRLPCLPYCSRSINHYQGHLVTFSGDYLIELMNGVWESVPYIHIYNPDAKCWDRVDEVVPHNYYFGMSVWLSKSKILFIGGLTGSYDSAIEKNLVTMCWILSVTPKHPSIIPY